MVDLLSFVLLSFSSILIVVNPLAATLIFVSLTGTMDQAAKLRVARDATRFALITLLLFTFAGGAGSCSSSASPSRHSASQAESSSSA